MGYQRTLPFRLASRGEAADAGAAVRWFRDRLAVSPKAREPIRARAGLPTGAVVQAIDLLYRAGAVRVAIVAAPPTRHAGEPIPEGFAQFAAEYPVTASDHALVEEADTRTPEHAPAPKPHGSDHA